MFLVHDSHDPSSRRFGWPLIAGLFGLALCSAAAAADDEFEQFKRSMQQGTQDIQEEFRSAVSAQEREFAEHLRTQWEEFQVFKARVRDMGPKPRALPVAPVAPAVPRSTPSRPMKPGSAARPKSDLIVKAPPAARPSAEPVAPAVPKEPSVPQEAPRPRTAELPKAVEPATPPAPRTTPRATEPAAEVPAPVPPEVPPVAVPVPSVPVPPPASPPPSTPAAAPTPATPTVSIDFFGRPVSVPVDPAWRSLPAVQTNPNGLANFWDRMSTTRFQPTLDAVAAARSQMALDDWGHTLLWQDVVRAIRPGGSSLEQLPLLWFFLVKSGLDTRPGYSENRLLLLVHIRQPVYGVSYVRIEDRPYYEMFGAEDGKAGTRYSAYSGRYPAALKPVDIQAAATGFVKTGDAKRSLEFDARGKRVRLDVVYERPVTRYLDRFPQLDFELYFTTPPSPVARRSLADALRPHLKGLSEEESVDFLLSFVQKAFEYKTDKDQFGREKYFFVEEVLHFPYSDCEDRSAMFSWLVRDLLGLDTVGLHYTGHMTTAVAMNVGRPEWQTVEWQGRRFVIADPTYINATVGMAMPSYRGTKPIRVVPMR